MSLRTKKHLASPFHNDLINSKKNLLNLTKEYFFKKLINNENKDSPKILVLDEKNFQIISILFSKKDLNDHQIFIFENINNNKNIKKIDYAKTICILEPSDNNIQKLKNELQKTPRSNEYYIYFTDFLDTDTYNKISTLVCPKVKILSELYLSVMINHYYCFYLPKEINYDEKNISKYLFNLALSLDLYPDIITSRTKNCQIIGNLLKNKFDQYENKNLKSKSLILILDREIDIITPLLTSWSYLSMIHEYLQIINNMVNIDNEKLMIDFDNDIFLKQNYFCNYGELGEKVKQWVNDLKNRNDKIKKMKEEKDIKSLTYNSLEHIEFNKCFTKHLNITNQIFNKIKSNKLLKISECEQELMCNENLNPKEILKILVELIKDVDIEEKYKIKLSLLYLLRYSFDKKKVNDISTLFQMDVSNYNKILEPFIKTFNENTNMVKIPGNKNMLFSFISKVFTNKESENVYLRYKPVIKNILENCLQGIKFDDQKFQYINNNYNRYGTIIIYIRGGITYEELYYVNDLNNKNLNTNIYLGGDCILNTDLYMSQILNNNKY